MLRLTRQVRFAIDPCRPSDPAVGNGHAGRPAIGSLTARYFELEFTVAGSLDPDSSYLLNIKRIDRAAREQAVPLVGAFLSQPDDAGYALPLRIGQQMSDAWPGVTLERVGLRLSPYTMVESVLSESPMVRLSHRFEFSAAHRLHNPLLSDSKNVETFGKCNNPAGHGHNYQLQVTLVGPVREDGRLIDQSLFEQIVDRQVIQPFDHKHLNTQTDDFASLNPSVENIARVCFERLVGPFEQAGVRLASVTVWETPKTWAEYSV